MWTFVSGWGPRNRSLSPKLTLLWARAWTRDFQMSFLTWNICWFFSRSLQIITRNHYKWFLEKSRNHYKSNSWNIRKNMNKVILPFNESLENISRIETNRDPTKMTVLLIQHFLVTFLFQVLPNWYPALSVEAKPCIILNNPNVKPFATRMTLNTEIMHYGIQESSVPAHTI